MFIHCTNNCLYVYCKITMSTNSNCCVLICVFTLRKECVYMSGCTIRVFQSASVELAYGCIMRYFAVILVSALMMATSSYGHPVVGSTDELQTGFDQVDWKSINNGGYAYITMNTDPKTGQPTVKVINSKSPWSADASSKLSSGIGSSSTLPTSKPATGYGATSYYSTQPEDTELTKEEKENYDWLVKNLSPTTPNADTKKPADEKEDTTKLTKEEQEQYDWLVNNIKPATPEDMQTQSTDTTKPSNGVTWRPKFGNRVYTGPTTSTTKPTSTNTLSDTVYKYPAVESDSTSTLTTNVHSSTTGSVYPSVSSGRYTGGPTANTYSGSVSPSSQTATPYKDDDPQTLVLTKDNIDLYFPDDKSPVFRNP